MRVRVDISEIKKQIEAEKARLKSDVIKRLQIAGEVYVATSKENGSYQDRTGNLRNSNGYGIKEGSTVLESNGRPETKKGISDFKTKHDISLVCGAGMDYASYVQRKGYDVSDSGQLAAENTAKRLFK